MNWDRVAGNWKQFKGLAKQKWAMLAHDDFAYTSGSWDNLVGRIQARYGIARDQRDGETYEWKKTLLGVARSRQLMTATNPTPPQHRSFRFFGTHSPGVSRKRRRVEGFHYAPRRASNWNTAARRQPPA